MGCAVADVEVIGAGPAGLAAAITLARAGRRVLVHEARRAAGARFGRDLQAQENWSEAGNALEAMRELGLSTQFRTVACAQALACDAWDRAYRLQAPAPICYLPERGPGAGSLDRALFDQAISLGVEVRFGSPRRPLEGPGILATGARTAHAIAVGYHFATDLPDGFRVILDDTLAPGGYAYLVALDGRATLKCCMFRDVATHRGCVQRALERFQRLVGFAMREPRAHAGAGHFFVPASASQAGRLLAGERAGFQDAHAGFGLRYALASGVMAARSLIEGADYDALWHAALRCPIESARINRALYARPGNRGYRGSLLTQLAVGDTRAFLHWLYRPVRVRAILRRWSECPLPRQPATERAGVRPGATGASDCAEPRA